MITLYENTRQAGTCRSCGARIDWYETTAGKRMPMQHAALPASSQADFEGRVILRFDAAASHWANCPDAKKWKGGKRARDDR